MAKVSIIIPVYNRAEFIGKCYENVIAQSLKDLEILFVDNGSSDDTGSIVKKVQEGDNRVKLLYEKERGSGYARNRGIDAATGEYIFFLDVDDYLPDRESLESLYLCAKRNRANVCGGKFLIYVDGVIDLQQTKRHKANRLLECNKEVLVDFKDYQYDFGYTCFLIKTDFLKGNSIVFPPYLRFQDPPFFVKCMIAAKWFYLLDIDAYAYRCSSASKKFTVEQLMDIIRGCMEELCIAAEYSFDELAGHIVDHLNDFWIQTCAMMKQDGRALLGELVAFEQKWKESFPDLYVEKGGLRALNRLFELPELHGNAIVKCEKLESRLKNTEELVCLKRWGFPYNRIHKGSSIVIWGAGDVGKDVYDQAILSNYCEVVAWVDKKYNLCTNDVVRNPEVVKELEFDYVLLATCHMPIAKEMEKELSNLGISSDKLVMIENMLYK